MTPRGLPTTRPTTTASATGSPKASAWIGTPAFAKAKIGMIAKLTQGWSAPTSRSRGESASRAASWTRRSSE